MICKFKFEIKCKSRRFNIKMSGFIFSGHLFLQAPGMQ